MDVRQVRYFLAVVDHGGVTRAAEALFVAQSSVSQGIRALERELGAELFERVGRGLVLTDVGRALIEPGRRVMAGMSETTEAVRRVEALDLVRLDVAVTSDLAVDPLADIIGHLRAGRPGVSVQVLQAADSDGAVDAVRRARCEVALCPFPTVAVPSVGAVALGRRELVLAVPPGHALAGDQPVSLSRVSDYPFVIGPVGGAIRELVERCLRDRDAALTIGTEVGVLPVQPRLVAAGAGVAVLPPDLAREAERDGAHVRRLDPRLEQEYGLVHRTDSLSAAARTFIAVARGRP